MVIGKDQAPASPILKAIAFAEHNSACEIRVHVSRRWFEKDVFRRAAQLFDCFRMDRTTHRNAVLFYLNMRRKKFAIIADEGAYKATGPSYWEQLAQKLKEDLQSTHFENATALAVLTVGMTFQKHFPIE